MEEPAEEDTRVEGPTEGDTMFDDPAEGVVAVEEPREEALESEVIVDGPDRDSVDCTLLDSGLGVTPEEIIDSEAMDGTVVMLTEDI